MVYNQFNDITRHIDEESVSDHVLKVWQGTYTYIMFTKKDIESDSDIRKLAIRMPGSTIGKIEIDKDDVIIRIELYPNTVASIVAVFPDNLVEELNRIYAGTKYNFGNYEMEVM